MLQEVKANVEKPNIVFQGVCACLFIDNLQIFRELTVNPNHLRSFDWPKDPMQTFNNFAQNK